MHNPYENACKQLEQVADLIQLKRGLREMLLKPKRELIVHFPVIEFSTTSPVGRQKGEYGTTRTLL